MFFGDKYKKVLKKESVYVEVINDMLVNKEQGSSLYLLENDIGLHKLLHHPDSKFKDKIKGVNAKVFLTEPIIQHYALFDNPKKDERILWAEERHKDGWTYAYNCYHVPKPYPDVWKNLMKYFSDFENTSEKLTLFNNMVFP